MSDTRLPVTVRFRFPDTGTAPRLNDRRGASIVHDMPDHDDLFVVSRRAGAAA